MKLIKIFFCVVVKGTRSKLLRGFQILMQPFRVESEGHKGKCSPERLEYLDQIVHEFQTTNSSDAKEQILANLANFAYDPLNYEYFRQLNILDLFLNNLLEEEEILIKFSIGGLCNLCLDPLNKSYIIKNGLKKIIKLLEYNNHDILLSTVTTLIFLITPESKGEIINTAVIKTILKISKEKNSRLENLTRIFLEDYCNEKQVKEASFRHNIDDIHVINTEGCC